MTADNDAVRTRTQTYPDGSDEAEGLREATQHYHDGPTSTPMTQRRSPWSEPVEGER